MGVGPIEKFLERFEFQKSYKKCAFSVLQQVPDCSDDVQKEDVLNLHTDLQIDIEHFPGLIMTCYGYVTYSPYPCRPVKHKSFIKKRLNNSVWPEKQ